MSLPGSALMTSSDEDFMAVAIRLAAQGQGSVEPNPMVGCILVRDGQVIGQGYHQKFGGPHAEIEALRSLPDRATARGATAYVTLEPCCHHGKTPPCTQALIDAEVARVVVAMHDPADHVNGAGIRQLEDAGIETRVGVLQGEAVELLAPYLKKTATGVPYVIAKWAMTADGKIATTAGESQWITGDRSRQQVHQLRGRVDAVMVGMRTVTADDPRLTARPPGPRTARRIVFCRSRVPDVGSRLVRSIDQAPLVLVVADSISDAMLGPLVGLGAEVCRSAGDDQQMVHDALRYLGQQGATNVMLEGGAKLMWSFLSADQIDECHIYVGAKLFAGQTAPGPIGGQGVLSMDQAVNLELTSVDRFDSDVRLIYRKTNDEWGTTDRHG